MQYGSLFKKLVVVSLISILSCQASGDLEPSELAKQKEAATLEEKVAAKEAESPLESTKKEKVEIPPLASDADLKEDLERLHQMMHTSEQKPVLDKAFRNRVASENPDIEKKALHELTIIKALNSIQSTKNTTAKNKEMQRSLGNVLCTGTMSGLALFGGMSLARKNYAVEETKSGVPMVPIALVGSVILGILGELFRQYLHNDFQQNEFTQINKDSTYLTEQQKNIEKITAFISEEEEQRMKTDAAKLVEEYKLKK